MTFTLGSLFSGYGGLDMAVGGDLQWYSEIEPAACLTLAHHHPDVPNLGNIKEVSWADVPRVDIMTGGYPCQPFSNAGLRRGTDDPRHLWPNVREGILTLRPVLTILENVAGHRSLGLDSVLGDVAEMGLPAWWGSVRASDAGAPHGRERLFIIIGNSQSHDGGLGSLREVAAHVGERAKELQQLGGDAPHSAAPAAHTSCHGLQEGHGQCPQCTAGGASGSDPASQWGPYLPALERWAQVLGRRWPDPTVVRPSGHTAVNPAFTEWMMGLPEGWITGVPGVSASAALKMAGNGVCPQQAALAIQCIATMAGNS